MPGRSRGADAEVRDQRTTLRWTQSELDALMRVQEREGVQFLADVPRTLTLRQIEIEKTVGDKGDALGAVSKAVGKSTEDTLLMVLKQDRLDDIIGDGAETLEKVGRLLGFDTREETLWALAKAQIESMSSALEKDVAE